MNVKCIVKNTANHIIAFVLAAATLAIIIYSSVSISRYLTTAIFGGYAVMPFLLFTLTLMVVLMGLIIAVVECYGKSRGAGNKV